MCTQPGLYNVTILAGDASGKPVAYALGTVELLIVGGQDPSAVIRTAAFQPLNNLKPEIAHIFVSPSLFWVGLGCSLCLRHES